MMKIVKKSVSRVAQVWCDIQNYLASKNQLDEHNLDFSCQRLEPRELLSATPVGIEVPDETISNQIQVQDSDCKGRYKANCIFFHKETPKTTACAGSSPLGKARTPNQININECSYDVIIGMNT